MKHVFTSRGLSGFYKAALVLLMGILLPKAEVFAQAPYCTPTYSSSCSTGNGDYISTVSLSGPNSNFIYNMTSACSGNANNYTYYNQTADVSVGSQFFWWVQNGLDGQDYGIWIDWNQDGDFNDADENIYASTTPLPPSIVDSGFAMVPATAALGMTRMRVRSYLNATAPDACNLQPNGETEDYNINVLPYSGCTGTPAAGTASATPSTVCAGGVTTLVLSGSTTGNGITIQWESSASGSSVWSAIPGADYNYFTTYVTAATDYRAVVTCTGGGTMLSDVSSVVSVNVNPAGTCQDSVWPGDANYDYVVDNTDPLYIALGNGQSGPARAMASISWYGQSATDWTQYYFSGINYKHGDCDGNGMIDSSDLSAVYANYSLTHMKGNSYADAEKVTGLPDLYLDLTGINLAPGTTVNVPIKFGTSGVQASNVYGIAATLNFVGFTPSAAPTMDWSSGWLGNSNNTLNFSKAVNNGRVDWTYARKDQTNTSGFGTLGTVTFTVPANAMGQVILSLDNVTMVDASGAVLTSYNVIDDTTNITTGIGNTITSLESAMIVPNPSTQNASLELSVNDPSAIEVQIMDVTGRAIWKSNENLSKGTHSIALPNQNMAKGIYMIHLISKDGQGTQTLKWSRQ